MNTAIEKIIELIAEMPENELAEVIDFMGFLKLKRERKIFENLQLASESSLDFWKNDIDDEAWNNV
jgi:hypothetical protein